MHRHADRLARQLYYYRGAGVHLRRFPVGGKWVPYPGAALDVDFLRQRYYWNGAERAQGDFATFTGATLSPNGVTTSPAAGITLATSAFLTGTEITVAASFAGITSAGTVNTIAQVNDGTLNETVEIISNSANYFARVRTGNVNQASFTIAFDTGIIHAMSITNKLNEFVCSIDGVAQATDTSGTPPTTMNILRIGDVEQYIRRVVIMDTALDGAGSAALTSWLLANG